MKKEFTVSTSVKSRIDLVDHILANRKEQGSNSSKIGVLLHGDPGTGKTSFVKMFATLTGMDLLVIEAPHITEEHIINIPFIVFKDAEGTGIKGNQKAKANGASIVLADSHLYSQIKRGQKLPDNELLKKIYTSHGQYKNIWEELGGTSTTIPQDIQDFRSHTDIVLFIDEFFRQPAPRIINMLRGILNGKLGTHHLPSQAYVLYASNLRDEGVTEMSANADFEHVEMEVPNKEEWFSWLVTKYKDTDNLNMEVINKFYNLLKQKHLSNHDIDSDVRASPRTWEQVLLYISASLPAKNENDAKSLISNIKSKFTHYKTSLSHEITNDILKAVAELVKETSGFEVGTGGNSSDEWRNTLEHQIAKKMKLGKSRTYVPIISGPAGIGKTSEISQAAHDLDLRYIYVDCSTLDPEMTMGIPVAGDPKAKDLEVNFSMPQLYQQIMEDIEKEDAAHVKTLDAAGKKAYAKKNYKYMIFFDELNRTSIKVFNGLRRVLLEKDFGDGLELPEEAIMVAAINPSENGKDRVHDLTLHMRDVVDVIDSAPSWKKTQKYLEDMKIDSSPLARKVTINTITKMFLALKTHDVSIPTDQRPFNIGLGDSNLYISPRQISHMISITATKLDLKLNRIKDLMSSDEVADKDKAFNVITDSLYSTIRGTLDNSLHKQGIDAPEFLDDLRVWIDKNLDVDGIFHKKTKTKSLESIIGPYFNDPSKDLTKELELINYVEGHDIHNFTEELTSFMSDAIKADEAHLSKNSHAARLFSDGKISKDEKTLVSNIEHLTTSIILAFKTNEVSGEMLEGVRVGVFNAIKALLEEIKKVDWGKYLDIITPMTEFQSRLRKVIKQ